VTPLLISSLTVSLFTFFKLYNTLGFRTGQHLLGTVLSEMRYKMLLRTIKAHFPGQLPVCTALRRLGFPGEYDEVVQKEGEDDNAWWAIGDLSESREDGEQFLKDSGVVFSSVDNTNIVCKRSKVGLIMSMSMSMSM